MKSTSMQMKSTSMQGSRDAVAVLTECMCRGMDSNLVRVQTVSAKRMLSGVIGEFIANPIAN